MSKANKLASQWFHEPTRNAVNRVMRAHSQKKRLAEQQTPPAIWRRATIGRIRRCGWIWIAMMRDMIHSAKALQSSLGHKGGSTLSQEPLSADSIFFVVQYWTDAQQLELTP